MSAQIDSTIYKSSFYGILNAQGDFWTPIPFPSEDAAREYLAHFWEHDPRKAEECLSRFKIVPVRIQLTELPEGQSHDR